MIVVVVDDDKVDFLSFLSFFDCLMDDGIHNPELPIKLIKIDKN